MIKFALIEDDKNDAERFTSLFHRYCQDNQLNLSLTLFACGKEYLCQDKEHFHVIFFDIELPDINGMELSKKVREKDKDVIIIFLTNLSQYAISGYEVNALDYILKPLNDSTFFSKMNKIIRVANEKAQNDKTISLNNGKNVFKHSDILYIEVQKHNVIYHTTMGNFTTRGSLKEIIDKMDNCQFSRCNYCYLVNLNHVKGIHKYDLTLDNDEVILISRNRKKEVMEDFSRFLGGSL